MQIGTNGHKVTVSVKTLVIGASVFIGALWGIIEKGGQVWSAAGWETPRGHGLDISATASEILEFRQQWQCDELQEQLDNYYEAEVMDQAVMDRIERIKQRMADGPSGLQCARFED